MTSRERFERWVQNNTDWEISRRDCEAILYVDCDCEAAWECWKACEAETAQTCNAIVSGTKVCEFQYSWDTYEDASLTLSNAKHAIQSAYPEAFTPLL